MHWPRVPEKEAHPQGRTSQFTEGFLIDPMGNNDGFLLYEEQG